MEGSLSEEHSVHRQPCTFIEPLTIESDFEKYSDASSAASSIKKLCANRQFSTQVEIDLTRLSATGIVIPGATRSRLADQFRVIKWPIIANAKGQPGVARARSNLVMVTSALSGEGKTFTAINLAMSIAAEVDCRVMLIDADVSRSTLFERLGLPPEQGLLDLLEARVDMRSVLLRTNIEKLSLLSCGTPHKHATELLASEAMRKLLDELADRYSDRIIVFDSPPLLLTTEARVLASHMGQIIVVVRAEQTPQAEVQRAARMIESCPIRMLLLNQARWEDNNSYGYGWAR